MNKQLNLYEPKVDEVFTIGSKLIQCKEKYNTNDCRNCIFGLTGPQQFCNVIACGSGDRSDFKDVFFIEAGNVQPYDRKNGFIAPTEGIWINAKTNPIPDKEGDYLCKIYYKSQYADREPMTEVCFDLLTYKEGHWFNDRNKDPFKDDDVTLVCYTSCLPTIR